MRVVLRRVGARGKNHIIVGDPPMPEGGYQRVKKYAGIQREATGLVGRMNRRHAY